MDKFKKLERKLLKRNAEIIEETLNKLNFKTAVREINIEKDYIEYCIEVANETNLKKLNKYCQNLAMATASPTGKIEIIIPVPGKSLVGIRLPKPTKKYLEGILEDEKYQLTKNPKTLKEWIVFFLVFLSMFFDKMARKIYESGKQR